MQVDALRRFYTSLKEQRSGSEMATRWCAQHGLLPREEAEAWVVEQAQVGGLGGWLAGWLVQKFLPSHLCWPAVAGDPWSPISVARASPLLLWLQKRNGGRMSPTKPRPKSAGAAAATKRKRPAASGAAPLPPVLSLLQSLLLTAAHRCTAAMCSCQHMQQQVHNASSPLATATPAESEPEAEDGSGDDFKSAKKAKKAAPNKKAAPGVGGAKKGKPAKKGGLRGWWAWQQPLTPAASRPAHLPPCALPLPAKNCCQPCSACAEEEGEDSGEDFQEAKPKPRPAAKKKPAAAAGAVAKKPAPAKDRAFEDGGLDAGGELALMVSLLRPQGVPGHVMCLPGTACIGCASAPGVHLLPAAPCLCLPACLLLCCRQQQ